MAAPSKPPSNGELQRWAAQKTREVTRPIDEEEADLLRIRDALLAAFRVTVAGVDVTRWRPKLPPELGEHEPPG